MKPVLILLAAVMLTGCDGMQPNYEPDQDLRHKYFIECMNALPVGPVETKYNDWDEVVAQCDRSSYLQSLRKVK